MVRFWVCLEVRETRVFDDALDVDYVRKRRIKFDPRLLGPDIKTVSGAVTPGCSPIQ